MYQVSRTSTILSNILREFNEEIHNQKVEFEKNLQAQKEKVLAQFNNFLLDNKSKF